ncbi:hypothetical protein LENED_004386 [Lentinula edodes]|uniref:Uncharacterized protein n=1 Tax=Lentinula edodes TaxID=5353 RepID=A0A1Q3E669_LENED|nr:hypothetical protein LENED_004386 [Lentinula edodes]
MKPFSSISGFIFGASTIGVLQSFLHAVRYWWKFLIFEYSLHVPYHLENSIRIILGYAPTTRFLKLVYLYAVLPSFSLSSWVSNTCSSRHIILILFNASAASHTLIHFTTCTSVESKRR